MKCQRLRRYREPGYPTRDFLQGHPELLEHVPERWRQNRLVLAVLGIALPLLLARDSLAEERQVGKVDSMRVAPLFVHGEGRGSFGGMVVNPPVFLSEDEARQVVQDEARKAGIDFTAEALVLKDVAVPVTDPFGFLMEKQDEGEGQKGHPPKRKFQQRDLPLDGYDKIRNIAFETVSPDDFREWEKKDPTSWCSVSRFDFRGTAETLTYGLARAKGDSIVAVFYEPGASAPAEARPQRALTEDEWQTFSQAREKAAKELGEEQLRRQVRDFVAWLKAQGVI